jgi:hypothetical protein
MKDTSGRISRRSMKNMQAGSKKQGAGSTGSKEAKTRSIRNIACLPLQIDVYTGSKVGNVFPSSVYDQIGTGEQGMMVVGCSGSRRTSDPIAVVYVAGKFPVAVVAAAKSKP